MQNTGVMTRQLPDLLVIVFTFLLHIRHSLLMTETTAQDLQQRFLQRDLRLPRTLVMEARILLPRQLGCYKYNVMNTRTKLCDV